MTVTVTPGSTAPLSSLTEPTMPASCWPANTGCVEKIPRIDAAQKITRPRSTNRLVDIPYLPSRARGMRHDEDGVARTFQASVGRSMSIGRSTEPLG